MIIVVPTIRITVLTLLFLSCALLVNVLNTDGSTPIARPLEEFPMTIGAWQAADTQTMQPDVVELLNVDDYILRNYRDPDGRVVNVYVSYFAYTDRTKGYHSPLNCMPGSGWDIADTTPREVKPSGAPDQFTVNRLLLQKGAARQVSLYWYQCRGRILHNEYQERIYRVLDSIFKNRTDGAFVRLIATNSEQESARDTAMLRDLAARLIPKLRDYLPE